MEIAGVNTFKMPPLTQIPNAQVTVPKIEKKEPTVHNSSIPYPFHKPSLDHALKTRQRMLAMFQEMFKDVKPLEFEDYTVYDVYGEKSELKIIKRPVENDASLKFDLKL